MFAALTNFLGLARLPVLHRATRLAVLVLYQRLPDGERAVLQRQQSVIQDNLHCCHLVIPPAGQQRRHAAQIHCHQFLLGLSAWLS